MKTKKYIPLLLLSSVFAACEHQEPFLFDAQNNGIYFNEAESGFQKQINFAERVLDENCSDTTIYVKINVLGHLTNNDRTFTLQTDTIAGWAKPQVTIPEKLVIPAGEAGINLPITIQKPALMDSIFGIRFLLTQEEGQSDFGAGIEGRNTFDLYVEESYSKPSTWQYNTEYLGDWSIEKQIFLCRIAGNANLENALNQQETTPKNLSAMAIDSIRNFYKLHPETTLPYNMPFYFKLNAYDDHVAYSCPDYWSDEQFKWVGPYNAYIFAAVCSDNGINTSNEYKIWTNINQEQGQTYNKRAVETMLSVYNTASVNKPETPVTEQFGVPILDNVNYAYQNCIPSSWNKGKNLLEPYYGAYQNPLMPAGRKKYTFMLNALYKAKKETNPNFCLYLMFPVIQKTVNGEISYVLSDEAFKGTEYATAAEALKDFNRIFREADVNNEFGFPIPEENE